MEELKGKRPSEGMDGAAVASTLDVDRAFFKMRDNLTRLADEFKRFGQALVRLRESE